MFALATKLLIGSVYKQMGEMMKVERKFIVSFSMNYFFLIFFKKKIIQVLWDKDVKMNTVHVLDVCRAIYHLFTNGKSREVYNVVDKGNTCSY